MEFTLRPWNNADISALVSYGNNPLIAQFMTDGFPSPYTEEKARRFIENVSTYSPCTIFAIQIGFEAVGGIGLHLKDDIYCKNAELGYWLGEPFWGKGIITRAIVQMVDYGFGSFDLNRIYARPFSSNAASQRVLKKAGFQLEAVLRDTIYKNGAYVDEMIYGLRRPRTG